MSKPIKITDTLMNSIIEEFTENVKKMKLFDGKISYIKNFKWDVDEKATVVFSTDAFAKMTMLVQRFDSEVAWHGVAYRDEKEKSRFYITDILVYPQLVSGSTVNTDQEKYQNWLYAQKDEVFNNIRMQGHSHVNFSTSPSGVDTTHQEKILEQLDDDMFYIFMIWNKKFERTIKIFDLANNTLFENGDVDVLIGSDAVDLEAFVGEAKKQVVTKTYQPAGFNTGAGYQYKGTPVKSTPASPAAPSTPIKELPSKKPEDIKSKPKKSSNETPAIGKGFDRYGDEEDYWNSRHPWSSYRH